MHPDAAPPAFDLRKVLSAYARRPSAVKAASAARSQVGCVIAGTQKGGTTALASYLYEHPEVSIPDAKEVHFFDSDWIFDEGRVDYAGYHGHFPVAADTRVLCDATPIYMYWNPAPERIRHYNPAMKWIFILRDPIERAYSHWNMQRRKGRDTLGFLEAIESECERCRAVLPRQHPWWSYADRGRYARQLRRVLEHFPVAQLLVLKTEDLRRDPDCVLERVSRFLGIARFGPVAARDVYSLPYADAAEPKARELLAREFERDLRDLERMFDLECRAWLGSAPQ